MSKVCEVCKKAAMAGNNVSHSHRRTRRSQKANLKKRKVVLEGVSKHINVCTKCLKNGINL